MMTELDPCLIRLADACLPCHAKGTAGGCNEGQLIRRWRGRGKILWRGGVRGLVRVGTGAKRNSGRMGGLRRHRQKGLGRTGSVE